MAPKTAEEKQRLQQVASPTAAAAEVLSPAAHGCRTSCYSAVRNYRRKGPLAHSVTLTPALQLLAPTATRLGQQADVPTITDTLATLDDIAIEQGIESLFNQLATYADASDQQIKVYFRRLARAEGTDAKQSVPTRGIKANLYKLQMSEAFYEVIRLARLGDRDIIRRLTQGRPAPSQGRNWASVAIEYFTDQLGLGNTTHLNNMNSLARTVHAFTKRYGYGGLALLAPHHIKLLGLARTEFVAAALDECIDRPDLRAICDVLDEYVIQPIRAGKQITLKIKQGNGGNFLARIEEGMTETVIAEEHT